MQAWFFVLMAVGDEPSNEMYDKMSRATMTRMLDARNILESIDDRLDNHPFAQQALVRKMHELIFHIFAQPGHKLESLFKE